MSLNLQLPESPTLKPSITVFGVGGAGGNAVNNMIAANLAGVDFVVANTDAQALQNSKAEHRIQLGAQLTQGLGAGSRPEVGEAAADEAHSEIMEHIQNSHMVFITAGMGGGTGTGAAPVVARLAREQGILTVGVVTKPFQFEGAHRLRTAESGLEELQKYVDTLIVIPNQNLFRIANEKTTFADAFNLADDVLHSGVRSITDLMIMPGLINLDFADVRAVMSEMGKAMMGTGEAEGEGRATEAAEAAISNPLLDNVSMKGARGVLINITGGADMTLFEVDEAANRIREEVDADANIIFGSAFNPELDGKIRVSVVATGIEACVQHEQPKQHTAHAPSNQQQSQQETTYTGYHPSQDKQMNPPYSPAASAQRSTQRKEGGFIPPRPVAPESSPVVHSEGYAAEEIVPPVEVQPQYTEEKTEIVTSAEPPVQQREEPVPSGITATSMMPKETPVASAPIEKEPVEESRGFGLFGRMPGLGRKNSAQAQSSDDGETITVERKTEDDTNNTSGGTSGSGMEDLLDIPAFLRRKK